MKAIYLALALCAGCASTFTDAAKQALTTTERVESAAVASFEDFDKNMQQSIVDKAKATGDVTGAQKALADYRTKRGAVFKALVDVQAVVATGVALIPLVELGQKHETDLALWMNDLFAAAGKLHAALDALGVKVPGLG